MLPGLDLILAVFEIDQHEMSLLRPDFLPAFQSRLQPFRLDLLQKRMRVHDFHSSQIGEGGLQAVAQLAFDLLLERRRERRMIGYPHDELQLVGRILFRIELGGSLTTQSAQSRKQKKSPSGNMNHCCLSFMSLESFMSFMSFVDFSSLSSSRSSKNRG